MLSKPQSFRSSETLEQPKKNRKVGRPKLPKGAAKGRTIQVRLTADDLKSVTVAAKANKQILSDWIRNTLRNQIMETWNVTRRDGKIVTFTYQEVGRDRAVMTAQVEDGNLYRLDKSGLELPLNHLEVETEFPNILMDGAE
jgi:hypothetical protein